MVLVVIVDFDLDKEDIVMHIEIDIVKDIVMDIETHIEK
jgi:hypothetical protein